MVWYREMTRSRGTQDANCILFEMFISVLAVCQPSFGAFDYLAYASIGGVAAAAVLYSLAYPDLRSMELASEPLLGKSA